MVNKALQDMVTEAHGEEVWDRIRAQAGIDTEMFLSSEAYPDTVTYQLAGAASQVLQRPVSDLLEAFGGYWVTRTALEGYGDLMAAGGRTLPEFLVNLPSFHTRICLIFPHLRPPNFRCSRIGETSLRLHYSSEREGLTPFVVGLIRGLGTLFQTDVEIQILEEREPGDREVFLISWPKPVPVPVLG
jgi:hypothetical protein